MMGPAPDMVREDDAPVSRVPAPSRYASRIVSRLSALRVVGLTPAERRGVRRRWSPVLVSFVVLVFGPAMTTSVYFCLLASDQFTSEARFAVREADGDAARVSDPERRTPGSAWRDAEVIASYIRSGALVESLATRFDFDAVFAPPGADVVARLPAHATREKRAAYWSGMVNATIEHTSGIVTLKVRAFRPADALSLAQAILASGDALAETLSVRMRTDRMARAEIDLRRAETGLQAVFDELTTYRDRTGLIDPVKAAADVSRLLVQVLGDRLRLERQVQVARQANPDAPSLPTLQAQVSVADAQIAQLRRRLAGSETSGENLAEALVRFEDIDIRRQLAERLYIAARDASDQARQAAGRRNVYLAVFLPPSLPQDADYPSRVTFSSMAAVTLLICWGIVVLAAASVRDHRL